MRSDHYAAHALIMLAALGLPACGGFQLNPVHDAKFVFEGNVKDQAGKPVSNAWVKVRGWETLTDDKGHWREEQIVNCGALREHPTSYEENDVILVEAPGFTSEEEHFLVNHPSFFQSCDSDQKVAFDTVLKPAAHEDRAAQEVARPARKERPPIDVTPNTPVPDNRNSMKRGYNL